MDGLNIVSLNARGLRGNKRHAVFQWLKEKHYDVCLLQETYCTYNFISKFKRGWSGDIVHSVSDSAHSRGVCILFRKGLKHTVLDVHECKNGRFIAINLEINGNIFSIINVYCPNNLKQRIQFLGEIGEVINEFVSNKQNLIIGGDFNCVNENIDRSSSGIDKSSEMLCKLKSKWNLIDIWRKLHPDSKSNTYIDPSNRGFNSRIDFFLCSNNIATNIKSSNIGCAPSPDHKFVDVSLKLSSKNRGKGYWKMNSSILKENEYVKSMENLLSETINEYDGHICKQALWEFIKTRIKRYTIEYCTDRSKNKQNEIKSLEEEVDKLDLALAKRKDENILKKRKECKLTLDNLYLEKAAGYQIRSRSKWVEQGEKSTKYFFGLEKSRQCENAIQSLKDSNGVNKYEDNEILAIAHDFYTNLYRTQNVEQNDIESYINSIPLEKTLSEDDRLICEGNITYHECTFAVNEMKSNKSPGLDGIIVEFYQTFWHIIGNLLVSVLNSCYKEGKLTNSQRRSVITLIHKKDEKDEIANYRPISLTNVDYRIAAFVLANRLQKVMSKIVNNDQTAYIKGRYIGHNIRLVCDTIDYFDLTNKSGILLSVDFRKAFDSLEWDFIFKTLKAFKFGKSFINWIKTLYNSPMACVKNNGYFSEMFDITRGIRQGCPVSSLLFILSVEILAMKIRNCTSLKGHDYGKNRKVKISQYADDAMLFLNNKTEICSALTIISEFGQMAGIKLNLDKCEGMWIGKHKNKQANCKLFGIKWPKVMRCLGIYVGHDKLLNEKLNWHDKIQIINKSLKSWSKRDLSLYGKIQLIKTFGISHLVQAASLLPTPNGFDSKLNDLFFKFIWRGKDRIKRLKMIKPHCDGGMNMIDVESIFRALKAVWIYRIIDADTSSDSWAQLAHIFMEDIGNPRSILNISLDRNTIFPALSTMHPFYKEIIICYGLSNTQTYEDFCNNIDDQHLWGNKFVCTSCKNRKNVLFLRNWIRSGVNKIKDLQFKDGKLDENFIYRAIHNKANIYTEILLVKKALAPFKQYIANTYGANTEISNSVTKLSTKQIYMKLAYDKYSNIKPEDMCPNLYEICNDANISVEQAFRHQLCSNIEYKLKEFNFKLLHGILPCNANLVKWRIKESELCDICNSRQTVEHLLFNCHRAVLLWDHFKDAYRTNITFGNIVYGFRKNDNQMNVIVTLLGFLLYKDWLIHSIENKKRSLIFPEYFFIHELQLREKIYNVHGLLININPLVESLTNLQSNQPNLNYDV